MNWGKSRSSISGRSLATVLFRDIMPLPKQLLIFAAIFLITAFCAFAQDENAGETQEIEQIEQQTEQIQAVQAVEPARFDTPARPGEKLAALGLALEGWNFNSRNNFAGGAALAFDVDIPYFMATGISLTASHNFADIVILEPAIFLRWYAFGTMLQKHTGLFAQAEVGPFIGFEGDGLFPPMVTGGLRIGYRHLLDSFYIEPYSRFGYPYVFGIGLAAGVKL